MVVFDSHVEVALLFSAIAFFFVRPTKLPIKCEDRTNQNSARKCMNMACFEWVLISFQPLKNSPDPSVNFSFVGAESIAPGGCIHTAERITNFNQWAMAYIPHL